MEESKQKEEQGSRKGRKEGGGRRRRKNHAVFSKKKKLPDFEEKKNFFFFSFLLQHNILLICFCFSPLLLAPKSGNRTAVSCGSNQSLNDHGGLPVNEILEEFLLLGGFERDKPDPNKKKFQTCLSKVLQRS